MRTWISRRIARDWRVGASFGPEDFRPRGRRRPPVALASMAIVRRPVSYYGVALDQPDPSAELPHERHVWRELWTVCKLLAWFAMQAVVFLAIAIGIAVGGLAVIMGAIARRN
jgi:hypothetical protein